MKTTHTPTPWDVSSTDDVSRKKGFDCDVNGGPYRIGCITMTSDAAFIVRAVNSHEELLAIARDALSVNEDYETRTGVTTAQTKRLREAIAKAEGR